MERVHRPRVETCVRGRAGVEDAKLPVVESRTGRWAATHEGDLVVFLIGMLGAPGELRPIGSTAATAAKRIGAREVDEVPVEGH